MYPTLDQGCLKHWTGGGTSVMRELGVKQNIPVDDNKIYLWRRKDSAAYCQASAYGAELGQPGHRGGGALCLHDLQESMTQLAWQHTKSRQLTMPVWPHLFHTVHPKPQPSTLCANSGASSYLDRKKEALGVTLAPHTCSGSGCILPPPRLNLKGPTLTCSMVLMFLRF